MYSWGWSKFGQTGHGDRQTVKTPKRIEAAMGIKKIACGNKHSMAINKEGIALSWGCGENGQTGHTRESSQLMMDGDKLVPTRIESIADKKIESIACGSIHSCLITNKGELYLCGFGEHFYPGETQHFFFKPKQIEMPEPIKQVACGQSHNVALSVTGNVYTWGSGEYGQLGYGIQGNVSVPRMVLDDKEIASVAAGRYHSFALSNSGALYSWGCGENGQLGLNSDENVALPTVVHHILGTVVGQVACGEHHTCVLTSAPWNKLSVDTQEWLAAEKYEYDLKKAILKKTHRGFTKKDLHKVKEEMSKWAEMCEKRKKENAIETEAEIQRDIGSIQYKETLSDTVMKDMDDNVRKQGILPQVAPEDPGEEAETSKQAEGVRLPKVKKKVHTKASARSSDTPFNRRATSAAAPTQTIAGQESGAPFTRTAFLKETAQMVRRMKAVVTEKGEAENQKELQRMIRLVFNFRKDYDSLRNVSRNLSREVEALKKEQKLLTKSNQLSKDTYAQCYEQLKALEMQLNTVTIKISETSENRKNYELSIAHLKEEDFENFNQLKHLRKQNLDNSNFFKKMDEMKSQALEEKEKAEAELEEFRKEIQAYQKFVNQQLQQFESILGIVRSQNEKREKAKHLRHEKARSKIAARIDKLQQEAEEAEKEAGGLTARLTSFDLKLRHFEDSFQKITAATGLTNPDAIVNKFFFKTDIQEQLETEIEDKEQAIEKLKAEEEELQAKLKEATGGFVHDTWHDVEVLSEANRQSEFSSANNKSAMARASQRIVFAQEGLMSLLSVLEETQDAQSTDSTNPQDMWTEEESQSIFDRVGNSVQALLDVEKERNDRLAEEAARREAEEEEQKKKNEDGAGLNIAFDTNALNELRSAQGAIDPAQDDA